MLLRGQRQPKRHHDMMGADMVIFFQADKVDCDMIIGALPRPMDGRAIFLLDMAARQIEVAAAGALSRRTEFPLSKRFSCKFSSNDNR